MVDPELRRSFHRGMAILLIPLSLLLIELHIVARNLSGAVESFLPGFARGISTVFLVIAARYLTISALRQLSQAADTPS